jgi:hypothetical protein
MMNYDHDPEIVIKGYGYKAPRRTTQSRTTQITFANWCINNAAVYILPLGLNAEVVAWIVSVLQSSGEMAGIENITTLEKVLKARRTLLRFPTEREWESALLTARVLFRTWEAEIGGGR